MDEKINAPKGGNGRRMRTIEFDEADAPLLFAAMRLAASTTLCYGSAQINARARLKHYQRMFLAFAPPESRLFREEATWCEIAIAMDEASEYSLRWTDADWPNRGKGRATVVIGRRGWTTKSDDLLTRERFDALAAALDTLAPAGCIRTEQPSNAEEEAE